MVKVFGDVKEVVFSTFVFWEFVFSSAGYYLALLLSYCYPPITNTSRDHFEVNSKNTGYEFGPVYWVRSN